MAVTPSNGALGVCSCVLHRRCLSVIAASFFLFQSDVLLLEVESSGDVGRNSFKKTRKSGDALLKQNEVLTGVAKANGNMPAAVKT